jgi:hypothetical protein
MERSHIPNAAAEQNHGPQSLTEFANPFVVLLNDHELVSPRKY